MSNIENLTERLFAVKSRLAIKNKDELAKRLGCSRPMLYLYESGQNDPPEKFMVLLRELETEAGIKQLIDEHVQSDHTNVSSREGRRTRMIPVLSWAHAGEAESYEELPASWQEHLTGDIGDEDGFGLTLRGDSMEPRYYEGDILLVSPNRQPYNGGLVVCRFNDDGIIFRQIEVIGEKIRLVPINVRYAPTDHKAADFSWIYPVVEMRRRIWK